MNRRPIILITDISVKPKSQQYPKLSVEYGSRGITEPRSKHVQMSDYASESEVTLISPPKKKKK